MKLSDKGAFVDPDVFASPGFLILAALAITATIVGYIMSINMGVARFPIWQLLIIIGVEVVAAYFFAAQG